MRAATAVRRPRIAKNKSFPAPVGGWIRNVNLATPDARLPNGQRVNGASVLENWFPTATGVRMRGGTQYYAQLDTSEDVTSLFTYVNGNNRSLFSATATKIFDISTASLSILADEDGDSLVDEFGNFISDGSVPSILDGFTGGDWVSTQFATTGGVFLDLVNGQDDKLIYDGATFYPINDEPLNSLNFDAQSGSFTEGATITGGTSGATAVIIKVIDDGSTGTLWLGAITGGPFQNNEVISSGANSALVDGSVSVLFGAFTGVDTADLSFNWSYKNRMFYIEKNSLNMWYLAVDVLSGTASKLPLGGVFNLGGSLLFGASWSIESGDGLSEQCIVATTEGEVAVFQGTDPASSSTWQKVGVYRIGKPRGPKATIKAGGDIVVATDIGFIPLSVAVQRDIAALSPSAISYPIEEAWNESVETRSQGYWHCSVWPTQQMVIVALPTALSQQPQMLVANARTGAWALFTGLHATCVILFGDRFIFGSKAGAVIEMETTGNDLGSPYTATIVPLFDPLKSPSSLKTGLLARYTIRAPVKVKVNLSLQTDYNVNLPSAPDDISAAGGSVWGGARWGTAVWGTEVTKKTFREWSSVGGAGYALAVAAQITSGSNSRPQIEYVETELSYDVGDILS